QVRPQAVSAASGPVKELVGDVAPYVTPQPKTAPQGRSPQQGHRKPRPAHGQPRANQHTNDAQGRNTQRSAGNAGGGQQGRSRRPAGTGEGHGSAAAFSSSRGSGRRRSRLTPAPGAAGARGERSRLWAPASA